MQLSVPYPKHPYPAYWGPPTASSDFCEENYIITTYVAEFINTLTNINYCLFCWHGLRTLQRQNRLTWITALPHLGLLGVGIFSAGFHISLREWPQFADDMSMVFPTAFILLRILRFQAGADVKKANRNTAIFFTALLAIYTVHLNINYPHLHSVTFGLCVHYIRTRTWKILSQRIQDDALRRHLKKVAAFGGVSFAFGFFLWLVDRFACAQLTAGKRAIGMPWSFILEFHGFWHIFTGIGAYVFIVLVDFLVAGAGEEAVAVREVNFGWPANRLFGNLPNAGYVTSERSNGHATTAKQK